jgi:hypothetical protein
MFTKYLKMLDEAASGGAATPPATWDEYVASLPEDQRTVVQGLYDTKNQSLLNTVKATREERDNMASDLRDAAKKAEKGSAAESQLLEKANALDEANKKADFFVEASEKQCKRPKAAWAIAKSDNLFNRSGLPDWTAIQTSAPELFGPAVKPKGKAGAGAGTEQAPEGQTINQFIRSASGTRTIQSD